MSLSGGHLNGVLVKSPGSVYIEGIGYTRINTVHAMLDFIPLHDIYKFC